MQNSNFNVHTVLLEYSEVIVYSFFCMTSQNSVASETVSPQTLRYLLSGLLWKELLTAAYSMNWSLQRCRDLLVQFQVMNYRSMHFTGSSGVTSCRRGTLPSAVHLQITSWTMHQGRLAGVQEDALHAHKWEREPYTKNYSPRDDVVSWTEATCRP